MTHQDISARVAALSPEKQQLLALRLGIKSQTVRSNTKSLAAMVKSESVDDQMVRQYLSAKLPAYMIPSNIKVVDALPRTPNGKIDRNAIKVQLTAPKDISESGVQTDSGTISEIEAQLIEIWEDLLGVDMITPEDDFFELGGYSLIAIRMFAKINEIFGVDLLISVLMESSTIAQLANRINKTDDYSEILLKIRGDGDKSPLYIFQVNLFGVIHYTDLLKTLDINRPVYGVMQYDPDENDDVSFVELADRFASAILANQPEGPYYFLGLSVAGLVAYEVARNLEMRGIQDVYVVMFDTYGPDYPTRIPLTRALLKNTGVIAEEFFNGNLSEKITTIRDLFAQLQYRASYRFTKYSNRLLKKLGFSIEVTEKAKLNVGGEAINRHYLTYFSEDHQSDVKILLYRSKIQPISADYTPTLHWDRYTARENIEVKSVMGAHSTLLKDSVQPIAEHLQDWLSNKI